MLHPDATFGAYWVININIYHLSITNYQRWSYLPFIRSGQNHLARHSEKGKKTRQREEEPVNLVERLDKASTANGMEIIAEKTKLMTNNTSGFNTEVKVNGQKLETVTSFKYLGSIITDEGSKPEILSRIAQTRQQQH